MPELIIRNSGAEVSRSEVIGIAGNLPAPLDNFDAAALVIDDTERRTMSVSVTIPRLQPEAHAVISNALSTRSAVSAALVWPNGSKVEIWAYVADLNERLADTGPMSVIHFDNKIDAVAFINGQGYDESIGYTKHL